jgi:hypothetical protein
MVERVHRQIKDALRACAADTAWSSRVPWVLLGLHEAPKEDLGISSADMVLGAPLQLPGELLMLPEPACSFPEFRPPHTLSYAALALFSLRSPRYLFRLGKEIYRLVPPHSVWR